MSVIQQKGLHSGIPGWVLSELVVALAIVGLVASLIGTTLVRQQRFYRGAAELVRSREGVRDAIGVLATDVRGLALADTVRLLSDSALEFFAGIGSSVVCASDGGWTVGLPASHGSANTLSSFNVEPDSGDLAFFYRDSLESGSRWERHRLISFSSSAFVRGCDPFGVPDTFPNPVAGQAGYVLDLATPLSAHVRNGAPVRFVRRGRYSLYRATDGDWFLGYRRCNALGASACGSIQPLSGPYRPYSRDESATGLLFGYFDGSGHRLGPGTSPFLLRRIDITAKSESRQRIRDENRTLVFGDSATISIAVRNR